ncbi:hypothetical protein PC121_g1878 [Phytophthora cactorum]|nr:hypothetical protein PC120_g940 [Phytophthora cactorum]KAG3099552.1 hypothetical protein PC121_g1878 [Phytophthora cactorum]
MTAAVWWDNKPVELLATGASRAMGSCERRLRGGRTLTVPCPSLVLNYQKWVGGVDVHDQLRLQRYSLQMSVTFKKYYKTLFLDLVDMALVSAYTVHREAQTARGETVMRHSEFLVTLQAQPLDATADDFKRGEIHHVVCV